MPPQLLELERALLADLSSEQALAALRRHGAQHLAPITVPHTCTPASAHPLSVRPHRCYCRCAARSASKLRSCSAAG